MARLDGGQISKQGALVVAEHHNKRQLAERYGGLVQIKHRRHGDSSMSIYRAGAIDA